MVRLLVFDLDSTLAPLGKGIGEKELELFQKIEENGVRIAICSGKTCDYLCGFMRQVGLKNPILIGENGAVIRYGVDLPPRYHHKIPFLEEIVMALAEIKGILQERFPYIWFQPNKIGVTPFPTSVEEFEEIQTILNTWREGKEGIQIFRHVDSFDIVPAGIDKATGIRHVLEDLGVATEEMIAIGDGVNDYCMFEMAGFAVGVNVKEAFRVNINFRTTLEMLEYIYDITNKKEEFTTL